ncbi:MAG: ribonuclease R family protein [Candidatus Hydrothermales bacterium]
MKKILEGKLEVKKKGYGFLIVKEGKDIFIPKNNLGGAKDGDIVKVVITKSLKERPEGKVLEVVKRAEKRYSGTLWKKYKDTFIEPDDETIPTKIIPIENVKEIPSGNKVTFVLTEKGTAKKIKDIGKPEESETAFNLVKNLYNLPEEYEKNFLDENKIKKLIREEIKKRKDLRNLQTFTIDPYNAKDFDDAISAVKYRDGYELFVHIADVSFFVPLESKLFNEAFERGTSYYLLNRVIHMLPRELSEKFCSLQPGKIRLCKTVHILLDKKGRVKKFNFYDSIIKSKKRFNYEEAQDILEGKIKILDKEILNSLKTAEEISKLLKEKRRKRLSLDFDVPEPEILFDEDGKVKLVRLERAVFTHSLIEECMIMANLAVAKFFHQKKLPLIYRIHESPDRKKLLDLKKSLSTILKDEKYKKIFEKEEFDIRSILDIIDAVKGNKEEIIVIKKILKAMKQARYSLKNIGHFGLKLPFYTHFTSPIRRLADLTNHNLLNIINKNMIDKYPHEEKLWEIAERASETERVAQKAEWDIVDMKILEHLKNNIGKSTKGIITEIKSNGFFVYIPEFYFEGFVEKNLLPFKARFDLENKKIHLKKGKKISLGDYAKVLINKVDIFKKKLFLIFLNLEKP